MYRNFFLVQYLFQIEGKAAGHVSDYVGAHRIPFFRQPVGMRDEVIRDYPFKRSNARAVASAALMEAQGGGVFHGVKPCSIAKLALLRNPPLKSFGHQGVQLCAGQRAIPFSR